MMLTWMIATALAADSWTATCSKPDDPSLWFIFSAAPDAPPLPDFDCKGLFFENASCTQTVGLGKILPTGSSPGGIPLLELRYLPYGELTTILGFLSRSDGGVLYKPPAVPATTYAATPPPPTNGELLGQYLMQRNKASAATKNVSIHVWTCPEAPFVPPTDAITPFGMTLVQHQGKSPLR